MRMMLWAVAAIIPGCAAEPTGAFLAVEAASVAVFGRGLGDIAISAISGRDCSIVRLDRGMTYCAPRAPDPEPGPFCTRSLGVVDCWADPAALPGTQREVADGPAPSPAQARYRAARWPRSLTAN